ncbi:MAG: triose-phosphate isomerase [Gemmataceae bacterium]
MRKKFVAGNWKMFTTAESAPQLAGGVLKDLPQDDKVRVAVFPPFPYLLEVSKVVRGTRIGLGGQNLYPAKEGAFTGEVSPAMLLNTGCQLVLIGHSERRHKLGESDGFLNQKVHAALDAGLEVVFCVGETLDERQANQTEQRLDTQLTQGLAGVKPEHVSKLTVAYEPVWAIGTGHNATPEQAQAAHVFIRKRFGELLGEQAAAGLIIQYGGSVTPQNAATLMGQPDVDGALVGGASLDAGKFLDIIRAGS